MTTPLSPRRLFATALLGGVLGGGLVAGATHWLNRDATRDYILSHPEILPEAVDKLKANDSAKQLAEVGPKATQEWPGAVLGNPKGQHVLVEFTDFACGYCRASEADVAHLIAADPEVKVVIRALPILTPESADAAKMGFAAAAQGKYAAFHRAMFAAGRPNAQTITAAAQAAGVDLAAAAKVIGSAAAQGEVDSNLAMARTLGINGTPSWIARGQVLSGAVGFEALSKAVKG